MAAISETIYGLRLGAMLACIAGAIASCTLAVDADSLNEGCPDGTKLCDGSCQSTSSPEIGCARQTCQPCTLPRATAVCSPGGECVIGTCNGSYEDCNGQARDGCEVDTDSDTDFCGSCNAAPCARPNSVPDCAAGQCAILRCITGFRDCNRRGDDGCEVNTMTDRNHCGDCALRCAAGEECRDGVCE